MDPKPGYTTTEFWSTMILHALTGVVTVLSLVGHTPFDASGLQPLIPVAALVMSGLAQAFYSHSRAKVKVSSLSAASDVLTTQAHIASQASNPLPGTTASTATVSPVSDPLSVSPQPL